MQLLWVFMRYHAFKRLSASPTLSNYEKDDILLNKAHILSICEQRSSLSLSFVVDFSVNDSWY